MVQTRLTHRRSLRLGAALAFAALPLLVATGMAQTPESGAAVAHPVHIHAGSCAELGEVVVPLADVSIPTGEHLGSANAVNSPVSLNIIDMPFADLVAGEYAVNVHESAEAIDTYIACGDVGGALEMGDDGEEIRFVLHELNDSGYTGVVFAGMMENDQAQVNVMMVAPSEMG